MSEPAWVPLGAGSPLVPGGLELIDKIDLSAVTAFQNIPPDYDLLRLAWKARGLAAGTIDVINGRFNGDSGANYDFEALTAFGASVAGGNALNQAFIRLGVIPLASGRASAYGTGEALIPSYRDGAFKSCSSRYEGIASTSTGEQQAGTIGGVWRNTAAVTRIDLLAVAGASGFAAGSVAWLYGLRGTKYAIGTPLAGQAALVTSLPASPVDGQEIILCDSLTAPTYTWHLKYVAAKASNKWVFVGGSPAYAEINTGQAGPGGTYGDCATVGPSLAVPVAGIYMVTVAALAQATGGQAYASYQLPDGTAAIDADAAEPHAWAGNTPNPANRTRRKTLTAGTLTMKYRNPSGGMTFSDRTLELTPVAIGG